jgi:hypothetical protein
MGWFIVMCCFFTPPVLDSGMQMETGNRHTLGCYDGRTVGEMIWCKTCISKKGRHGGKEVAFEIGIRICIERR